MRVHTTSEFTCDEDEGHLLVQVIEPELLRITVYQGVNNKKADVALTRDSVGDLIATLAAFVLLMED